MIDGHLEQHVMELYRDGMPVQEIAATLGMTEDGIGEIVHGFLTRVLMADKGGANGAPGAAD